MSHFNEYALELSIMELFQQEGYLYTNGEEIHKEADEVLLRDDMCTYLSNHYREVGITSLEIESVWAKLTANTGLSLYDNNAQTYRLITEGFSLKREDTALPDLFIEPIDFSEEGKGNNLFRIVNQLEIKGMEKRLCQRGAGSGTGVQECRERRHNHHGCLYAAHRALSARHPRLVQIQCFRGRQRWGEQQIRVAVFTLRLLLYLAESGGRRQGDRWHQFAADHGQRVVPQRQTTERNQGLCVLS